MRAGRLKKIVRDDFDDSDESPVPGNRNDFDDSDSDFDSPQANAGQGGPATRDDKDSGSDFDDDYDLPGMDKSPVKQPTARVGRGRSKTPSPQSSSPLKCDGTRPFWAKRPTGSPRVWRLESDFEALSQAVATCCPLTNQVSLVLGEEGDTSEHIILYQIRAGRTTLGKLLARQARVPGQMEIKWCTWSELSCCPVPLCSGETVLDFDDDFSLSFGGSLDALRLDDAPDIKFFTQEGQLMVHVEGLCHEYRTPSRIPALIDTRKQMDSRRERKWAHMHLEHLHRTLPETTHFSPLNLKELQMQLCKTEEELETGLDLESAKEVLFGSSEEEGDEEVGGFLVGLLGQFLGIECIENLVFSEEVQRAIMVLLAGDTETVSFARICQFLHDIIFCDNATLDLLALIPVVAARQDEFLEGEMWIESELLQEFLTKVVPQDLLQERLRELSQLLRRPRIHLSEIRLLLEGDEDLVQAIPSINAHIRQFRRWGLFNPRLARSY